MSKKRFTDGLESLFGAPESPEEQRVLIVEKHEERADKAASKKKKSRSSRKNFTSDLDSLFAEATAPPREEAAPPSSSRRPVRPKPNKVMAPTGLDALIRRTVEERFENTAPDRKRLTLTLDRNKVTKLKRIARHEKSYLRDIVGELVADYIKKYEQENGDTTHLN